jgi:glycerophosphoryl diester phosphodiesterase
MDGKKLPLAIGHRGASGHATENTLTAFAKASDLGAEMWELDTQLTKDGVCVVSHDDHLQRVFAVSWRKHTKPGNQALSIDVDAATP